MSSKRTKIIIAVFGGSEASDVVFFSERLGRAVARAKEILLTGGTGPADKPIKNRAILGAAMSPWIGVDRKSSGEATFSNKPGHAFVIRSNLDHKRNYLEALMCDAAIGLEGGRGTISEVTSALSLQRPVALVGNSWREWDLDTARTQALDSLADITSCRFVESRDDNHELDTDLTREAIRSRLSGPLNYKYFDLNATAETVISWIESALPGGNLLGTFPNIESHSTVRKAYLAWLTKHACS
jgi:predicted Rossmann-fold nucleotide-binding protein